MNDDVIERKYRAVKIISDSYGIYAILKFFRKNLIIKCFYHFEKHFLNEES